MSSSERTQNHDEIRKWIEKRDGHPAIVDEGKGEDDGILRVEFRDPEDRLTEIDWDRFFEIFDKNDLVFLYQERTADGKVSRFNKFVSDD